VRRNWRHVVSVSRTGHADFLREQIDGATGE